MQNQQRHPRTIIYALCLSWVSRMMGILPVIFRWNKWPETLLEKTLATTAFFVLVLFPLYMAGRRKKWARIAVLIYSITSLPEIPGAIRNFSPFSLDGAYTMVLLVSGLLGAILMFVPESNAWFRSEKLEAPNKSLQPKSSPTPWRLG